MVSHEFQYVQIAAVDEIPPGERMALEIDSLAVLVMNIGNKFFAIGNLCPHDLGELDEGLLEGHEIVCPRHGARFDVRTGKVLRLPATQDIPSYPIKIEEGYLFLGIPKS